MNNFLNNNSIESAYLSVSTILNSLDAAVYVADLETYEMIFMNKYAVENWGEHHGAPCYSILQKGQDKPCEFCTNHLLVDEAGEPTGVYVWQFQNTINKRWYECRDQAIPWVDGRLVRMEIAIDITDRREMELGLKSAKEDAEKRANIDDLTQVRNRRSFFEDSERMIRESKGLISLIMLDIDYFKQINDTYGHTVGDTVLEKVAKLIEDNIRKEDIFGRVGGEEFALLVPLADMKTAHAIAENLRQKIDKYELSVGSKLLNITCSFGVASGVEENIDKVYANADSALYMAKNNGRNRVELYTGT